MSTKDAEAKNRILQTAISLLQSAKDPAAVTIRQIAEAANVGIGLINYHFQTKDKLLNTAAAVILSQSADALAAAPVQTNQSPEDRLKTMLKELSDISLHYDSLNRLSVSYTLTNGSYDVPLFITPMLREIFGEKKSELEIRLMACQIIVPMQFAFLRPSEFLKFSGCDIYNKAQRDSYIDKVVQNILNSTI